MKEITLKIEIPEDLTFEQVMNCKNAGGKFVVYQYLLPRLVAAISGAFISNPLTSPFLLMISYKVGGFFTKNNVQFDDDHWFNNLPQIGYVLVIGASIVSFVTGLIIYFITKYLVERRRKIKSEISLQ